jgi:60 kDa SS-A/Ro ribonucleoprotein
MPDALSSISRLLTPQNEKADSRQVKNSAGGFTFTVDEMQRLRRFLILGTDGGTYYTGEREHTRENAQFLFDLAARRGVDVVNEIVAVSDGGHAPKNNQALFALAAVTAVGDQAARTAAYGALPKVARTGTHLFQFVGYVDKLRGWGRGLRTAVGGWYLEKTPDQVAYQVAKYGQREGWSHRDVLRKAHPNPADASTPEQHDAVLRWAAGKENVPTDAPTLIYGVELAKRSTSASETAGLVREYGLTWEMLQTEHLNDRKVWEALLESGKVGVTALIRQLPRLTKLGLLDDLTWQNRVISQLIDVEVLRKGRVHPINVLVAQRTYASGHSVKGSGTWTPVSKVVDALDAAFYAAFGAIAPSGTRHLLALDVSGSMGSLINGLPLSAREASAAMALVTVATESNVHVVGFTGGGYGWGSRSQQIENLSVLDLSSRRRLDDNIRAISGLPFGGTDCALPMIYAQAKGLEIDSFSVYTDNETWAGSIHPHQALRQYRNVSGINARLVVAGMSSTGFTIADPTDPGMLDVVGLDSSAPGLISSFFRGDI